MSAGIVRVIRSVVALRRPIQHAVTLLALAVLVAGLPALARPAVAGAVPVAAAAEPGERDSVATAFAPGAVRASLPPTPSILLGPLDPTPLVERVVLSFLRALADALRSALTGVLTSPLNFVTQTPPTGSYGSATVTGLWNVVRAIANGALVLVAVWGGFTLMAREQLAASYHEALELLPRLVLGALLVNTSLVWGQLLIDANNALCSAVGQASLPAWQQAGGDLQAFADVVAGLLYLVTGLFLVLQMLMRLALVDVLLVVAPLALVCWVLPQTQGWARRWSSTFTATVFTQFVQVVALKLGASLFTDLAPATGVGGALLPSLVGSAVLVLTLKIPGLLRSHVGDGLGFARFVVYQRAASVLRGK